MRVVFQNNHSFLVNIYCLCFVYCKENNCYFPVNSFWLLQSSVNKAIRHRKRSVKLTIIGMTHIYYNHCADEHYEDII